MTRRLSPRKRLGSVLLAVVLPVGVFVAAPGAAWSQANSATFYGTVADPTGAMIPGATVTLTNLDTKARITKTTSSSGDFAFSFVAVGTYTLTIEAAGFKGYIRTGFTLAAGQQVRETFNLELGAVTETVSVQASAPLVNTVSAQQLHNYSLTEARELPLLNRNFTGLLRINAGIVPSYGNLGTGVNLNGVGRNGTVYSLDGTNASGNSGSNNPGVYQGGNLVDVMSVEGIQDVNVVKGVIPAEYANAVGGQVNAVSKSGTNAWRGSVFANHQDSALNARFQRVATKPRLTFNQFGGSIGGPLKKDKIFIFGDYEAYRRSESVFVQGNVPTAGIRDQILKAVPDLKLALQFMPLPNQPLAANATVGSYAATDREARTDNHFDVRGDIVLTNNSRLTLTYNHGQPYRSFPRIQINNPRTYNNALNRGTASYVSGGSNWTSETRVGYNKTIQDRLDGFFTFIDPNQPKEAILYGRRLPGFSTGLGWGGPAGEINHSGGPLLQVEEKYARYIGGHSLKFGGHYRRSDGTRNNPECPQFYYASLAALLDNAPNQVTATLGSGIYSGRMYEFGVFAQDDWGITRKLTVNLGLRYDFYSNFVARGQGGTPEAGLHNPEFLSMDGRFEVGPYRPPTSPYSNDAKNFGPRVGFAYNPDGNNKTAIRAGFGAMFMNVVPEDFWNLVSSAPNVPYRIIFAAADIKAFGIKYPDYNENFFRYAQQVVKTSGAIYTAGIYNTHLQAPYTMQYTLDIQRQVTPTVMFQTAVVGTRGLKFILFRPANAVDRITGLRPNPRMAQPYYIDNSQTLTYYGWQNSFRKRFSRGLSLDAHYTWSKALGNGGGDTGAYYDGENSSRNQDFFNLRADRGPTISDITHYFTASWVYQLPALAQARGWIRHGIGGWQIAGILTSQTGYGITVGQSSTTPNQRGDYIGGVAVLSDYRKTLQYLNPAAFQRIPVAGASGAPVRPGNFGPGQLRAPGMWNLNFSLAKNFLLSEGVTLQVRTDAFNALNHTNLSGLRTSLNDAFFGRLLSTQGARVVQLNARITF